MRLSVRARVLVFVAVLFAVAILERWAGLSSFVAFSIAAGVYLVVVLPAITRRR